MSFLMPKLFLLLISVTTVCSLQCFYFPREFITHKEINNETLRLFKCNPSSNYSNNWNEFLKTQINFLLLQHCITYNGTLTLLDACVSDITATLQPLFDNPLCRDIPTENFDSNSWACIFDPLNPCLKSERAGPKHNILSLLCKLKSLHSGKNDFKGALKTMGLDQKFLHFFTAGRFMDTPGQPHSRGSSIDKDTFDFISNFRCSKYVDGNCCSGPSGCNLPSRLNQTSFYASVGADELLKAYAEDPHLRSYLASAAGVDDLWQRNHAHQTAGLSDHHRTSQTVWFSASNGVIIAVLSSLAFACLAIVFCLFGAWCANRRNRLQKRRRSRARDRLQVSDEGAGCLNSVFKRGSSPPCPEDGTPPSGSSFSYGHHHGAIVCGAAAANDSAAAEKLLSASASSSVSASSCGGAFNCPTPVGVAGGDDRMKSHQHQHHQRMIAVPNKNHRSQQRQPLGSGGSGGGSSGVGTAGDSQPSTSWNSSCVVVPNCQPLQPPEVLQRTTEGVIDSVDSQTGSGSGQPILLPRTIAREIEHRELIGQGRFGQVFRSVWRNDPVAVKIFSSRAESSWSTEGHIYELPGMRHDAILGFIAIDNIDIGVETQLWLITDYHANGSLQSYLTRCTVDQLTLARMLHSIASGLAYLHSEIAGVKCKPAIAHRDIKSNNILVKADLSCCIADFGLAVALQPGRGGTVVGLANGGISALGVGSSAGDSGIGDVQLQQHKNNQQQQLQADNGIRVGTRRYLSPECLNGTQDAKDFTALRKADVYAAGLVFWELAARCHDPDRHVTAEQAYLQPYHGLVPANPTLEQMQAIVCSPSDARPPTVPGWLEHPVLGRLCRVMTECWYPSPAARLEAMSVKDQTARMLQTANQLQLASAAADAAGADGQISTVVA